MAEEHKNRNIPSRSLSRRIFIDPATPSVRSIVRTVIITLLILAVWSFFLNIVSSLTHLFFLIVLAVFFAYLIEPLVQIIGRPFEGGNRNKYMPRTLAIAAAYLIIFSIIGVAIALLAPQVSEQARLLTANLPGYITSLQNSFKDFGSRYDRYKIPEQYQEEINKQISDTVSSYGGQITSTIGVIALSVVSYLPWLVLIPILSFFFLKDANLFRLSLLRVFPHGDWRERIESIIHDVNKTLAAYVRAQLISCVLIGTICTIGFYILGLNYALLLGILAAAFEFIPLIGPLTIGITAVTVAGVSNSAAAAGYVAIFLIVLRICQDYIFYPRIIRGGIHLHPLAIILSVLAGEEIAGIPGVFLSVPIIALLTVLYRHILEHSGSRGIVANILAPKEEHIEEGVVEEQKAQVLEKQNNSN
ncbi:MAG: AI-2E family transporter [Pyrinomonadaceae bacterium]